MFISFERGNKTIHYFFPFPCVVATKAFGGSGDAHSDSQKSSKKEKPKCGFCADCEICVCFRVRVRLCAGGKFQNKTTEKLQ